MQDIVLMNLRKGDPEDLRQDYLAIVSARSTVTFNAERGMFLSLESRCD